MTLSLVELTANARFTMTNPGSNAQNDALKLRSNPAHVYSGIPTQAAAAMLLRSYRPNGTANATPKRIAMIGAHCCSFAVANSLSDNKASNVTPATMGALPSDAPSGTSDSLPITTVKFVAASSMRTVPATTGVRIRRSKESREIRKNWITADTTMRLDSIAGPPTNSALVQIAINAVPEFMLSA